MEKTMDDDIFLNEMKIRWMRSEVSYSRWAASFGLTLNEVWILLILSTFAGKSCKQADLVKITTMPKQTVSYVVGQLARKELIVHSIGTEDKRSRIVHLTGKGKEICGSLIQEMDLVGKKGLGVFTKEDRVSFIQMHNDYIETLIKGFYDCIDERKTEQ